MGSYLLKIKIERKRILVDILFLGENISRAFKNYQTIRTKNSFLDKSTTQPVASVCHAILLDSCETDNQIFISKSCLVHGRKYGSTRNIY